MSETCTYLLGRELGTAFMTPKAEKKRLPAKVAKVLLRMTWSESTTLTPPVLRLPLPTKVLFSTKLRLP